MAVTPVFLAGEIHGQRTLVGYSPYDCKESDILKQLRRHVCDLSFLTMDQTHTLCIGR